MIQRRLTLRRALVAPIIAAGLLLAGCGGDTDADADADNNTTSSTAPTESAPTEENPEVHGPVPGTATMNLNGTEYPLEPVECISDQAIIATGPEDNSMALDFNDLGEFVSLTFNIGKEYMITYTTLGVTESDGELTGTVSGNTYTVTGSAMNVFDVGGDLVDVELVVTCG
ncbi:lipoprotein LpqH [Stackebrandtia endophytica]|nr:lipoprotein LpqH [Stackebrandtia endophytica]